MEAANDEIVRRSEREAVKSLVGSVVTSQPEKNIMISHWQVKDKMHLTSYSHKQTQLKQDQIYRTYRNHSALGSHTLTPDIYSKKTY